MHRFVAGLHMLGTRVGIGIHSHSLDAHAAGSGCHTAGDFTAIGNQDFLEHRNLFSFL
jgi:hypothetical protein